MGLNYKFAYKLRNKSVMYWNTSPKQDVGWETAIEKQEVLENKAVEVNMTTSVCD